MPSIKTYDIKSDLPTVSEAEARLRLILFANQGCSIIKVVHGYGSTGKGGKIKQMTHELLKAFQKQNKISGFIPGEATVSLIGCDELIRKHHQLLKTDSDFKKGNDGITYVIFRK